MTKKTKDKTRTEQPSLEKAFSDFLKSGQSMIPNVVVVSPQKHEMAASGIGSELRTAAYAIGLAALLAGAIFGGIALGTQYSNGYIDKKVQEKVGEATKSLKADLEHLQERIEKQEKAAPKP
ncbi:MAG: hypothetical protein GY743_14270 [Planctomycetaceae bacterium]|nr:hypothetical protein [Planctomycetaceae bacterium]